MSHYRARTHHGMPSDRDAWQDGCAATNGRAGLDRGDGKRIWILLAPGVRIIGERYIWPNKNIIFNSQAVPELDTGFDRDAVANDDIILDQAM